MMAKFSLLERRVLELPLTDEDINDPEAEALRKILDIYPFILNVAEYGYDPNIAIGVIRVVAAQVDLKTAQDAWTEKRNLQTEAV